MSADVLIVGGDGLISTALADAMKAQGLSIHASTRRPELAVDGRPFVDLATRTWPDIETQRYGAMILAAGATSIVRCAEDPTETRRVNVDAVADMAAIARRRGVRLMLLSTADVFDGTNRLPKPSDPVAPASEYGRQKAEAERIVLGMPSGTVFRLAKVFTPRMPLFQGWARDLRRGHAIHPFSDRYLAPVSIGLVCEAATRIYRAASTGIWHLSATDDLSYADVARILAARLEADPSLVQPQPQPAALNALSTARPATTLDVARIREELGIVPPDSTTAVGILAEELAAA